MRTFYHSGRIGDIIYSLPTIQAFGGGRLITGIPPKAHEALAPLLLKQSCIEGLGRIEEEGLPKGFINLDHFRQTPGLGQIHLVNAHLRAFGFPDHDFHSGMPWLEQGKKLCPQRMAVINYTGRYQDRFFSWEKEARRLKKLTGTVLFLGSREEYDRFPGRPFTYFLPTADLLFAARIIANAKYFSGSQSSLLAIRQALGLSYRMEHSPNHQDVSQGSPRETVLNPVTRRIHLFLFTLKKVTT